MATKECDKCGDPFHVEPMMCGETDLSLMLKTCDQCASAAAEESETFRLENKQRQIDSALEQILPIDLRETDIRHPGFNPALWSFVSTWRPTRLEYSMGIIGPAGKSKTRVMALMAAERIREGAQVAWISAVELRDVVADRTSKDRGAVHEARETLNRCKSATWLFLDDLGKNEWGTALESQLFQLLDYRMNHRLSTVWSSNMPPTEFPFTSAHQREPIIGRLNYRFTIVHI